MENPYGDLVKVTGPILNDQFLGWCRYKTDDAEVLSTWYEGEEVGRRIKKFFDGDVFITECV